MRRGPTPGMVYDLTEPVIFIGYGMKNDIVIDHYDVSRNHCRLEFSENNYLIEDLQSSHGTFINGVPVNSKRPLRANNLIELGDSITLEYQPDAVIDPSMAHARPAQAVAHAQCYLVLKTEGNDEVYELKKELITLGRDLSNDIVIQDSEISRWHLILTHDDGSYVVEDKNSTNGTFVNGVLVTEPVKLNPLDVLQLGTNTYFNFVNRLAPDKTSNLRTHTGTLISPHLRSDTPSLKYRTIDTQKLRSEILDMTHEHRTTALGTGLQKGGLENHICVAYAREDWQEAVVPLVLALQDAGIDVWVDQYLTLGGDDWKAAVDHALQECWLMIFVVSPASLDSRYTRQAYRYFINREKPVIPVVYNLDTKLPPELLSLNPLYYKELTQNHSFQRLILEVLDRHR